MADPMIQHNQKAWKTLSTYVLITWLFGLVTYALVEGWSAEVLLGLSGMATTLACRLLTFGGTNGNATDS